MKKNRREECVNGEMWILRHQGEREAGDGGAGGKARLGRRKGEMVNGTGGRNRESDGEWVGEAGRGGPRIPKILRKCQIL